MNNMLDIMLQRLYNVNTILTTYGNNEWVRTYWTSVKNSLERSLSILRSQ